MIFKTFFAIVGLCLAGDQAGRAQSCFFPCESVWLRVQPVSQDRIDSPPVSGTDAGWPLLVTLTRYSWPVMAPASDSIVPDEIGPSELHSDLVARFGLDSPKPDTMLLMHRLRCWRIDLTEGLGITSRNHACRLALDYSDVSDSSRFSDKGGNGISLLFRYSFEKQRQLARLAYR